MVQRSGLHANEHAVDDFAISSGREQNTWLRLPAVPRILTPVLKAEAVRARVEELWRQHAELERQALGELADGPWPMPSDGMTEANLRRFRRFMFLHREMACVVAAISELDWVLEQSE